MHFSASLYLEMCPIEYQAGYFVLTCMSIAKKKETPGYLNRQIRYMYQLKFAIKIKYDNILLCFANKNEELTIKQVSFILCS